VLQGIKETDVPKTSEALKLKSVQPRMKDLRKISSLEDGK
jgi:hypothetical protein